MFTFGSLFAGIGGIDLGLERAGMICLWQVEKDPFCRQVLRKHWPEIQRYGDIKAVDFNRVEPVKVLAGGFPCQPVSQSGKRKGENDPRWLWPEFYRAICQIRPPIILVENVPGLLYRGFDSVLGDLAESGYDAQWTSLSAASIGAPHIRSRLFLLAYPSGLGLARNAMHRALRSTAQLTSQSSLLYGWPPGPRALSHIPRMVDGVPTPVDRIRALGNAVVPQVAEWIGRSIIRMFAGVDLSAGSM
jgi:DNA (cytosine-5)-methyltransferase 1